MSERAKAAALLLDPYFVFYFMERGKRVFEEKLGPWPRVFQEEDRLVLVAPLMRPQAAQAARNLKILTAVIIGGLVVAQDWQRLWWVGLVVFFVVAWIGPTHWFWMWMLSSKARVVFEGAGFSWSGAGGRGSIKGGRPGEDWDVLVPTPHRQARTEALRNQRHPNRHPVYQLASEVVVASGYGKRDWVRLAELAEDDSGERGNLLKTAIEFVALQQRRQPRPAPPGRGPVFR